MKILKIKIYAFLSFFYCLNAFGQNSVGIGTFEPNPNAVLELVSPSNDQGLLVPRLSTAQRTSQAFVNRLTAQEHGLLVFDSDDNNFYFWSNGQWQSIGNATIIAGLGIAIADGLITNTGDLDSTNEIQDLIISDNQLSISRNSNTSTIDLSVYLDNTDSQTASDVSIDQLVTITAGNVQQALEGLEFAINNRPSGDMFKSQYDQNNDGRVDTTTYALHAGTVNGLTVQTSVPAGALFTDDQIASEVGFSPTGSLTATDVQGALVELASTIETLSDGDMLRAVYDTNGDGVVDQAINALEVNGFTVESAVPDNAIFTDSQTAAEVPVINQNGVTGSHVQAALENIINDLTNIGSGLYIESSQNNGDGTFTLFYSDGSSFTSLDLTGPQGEIGPQGAQGIQGVQGVQGEPGPQGPIGLLGTDGRTILSGAIDPNGGLGADGDFYINTNSNFIFGPKTSGVWATGLSLVGPQGEIGPQGAQGIQGIQGVQGVQGDVGPQGPQGDQGLQGIQGEPGPQGPIGLLGTDGRTILSGAIDPNGGLGADGDFYINTNSNFIFGPKTSGVWGTGLSLVGPQGEIGPQGAQGIQGVQGVQGPQGDVGPQGPQGDQGLQGIQGIQGIQGETGAQGPVGLNGADGRTVLNGTNNPSGGLGSNGDFFINTATNFLFGPKTSGVWGSGISLVGPQGEMGPQGTQGIQGPQGDVGPQGSQGDQGLQGIQGIQGIQGETGAQGPAGLNGADGRTVLNGTNNPTGGLGSNGDFFINTATNFLFGPKTSGVWGSGISLVGPQGAQGIQGPQGDEGPQGPQGDQGLQGIQGIQGVQGPAPAGTGIVSVVGGVLQTPSSLMGDVTTSGGGFTTQVNAVGGQSAANIATGVQLANNATDQNTFQSIVRRDGSGNFIAGTITASLDGNASTASIATNFSGELAGDVTGSQSTTMIANDAITTAKIQNAAITNAKLDKANISLSGFAVPTANISFDNNLITNMGNPSVAGDAANKGYVDAVAASINQSQWTTAASNIYYSIGNIGLGTASPTTRLDVNGTARMTGFQLTTGAINGYILTSNASGLGTWQLAPTGLPNGTTNGQTLRYNGSNWVVNSGITDNGNGSVTINGATNTSISAVRESSISNINPILEIRDGGVNTSASALRFTSNAGEFINIGKANGYFAISAFNSNLGLAGDLFRITSTANFGIGMVNPTSKLHVNGDVAASEYISTTGGITIPAGQSITSAATALLYKSGTTTILNNLASSPISITQAGVARIYVNATGDVGVGTTTPIAKFHVIGDTQLQGNVISPSNTITITGTAQIITPTRKFVKVSAGVTTGRQIHGIAGGVDGQELIIALTNGSQSVVMVNNSLTPNATDRIYLSAATFTLSVNAVIHLIYDGSSQKWLEVSRSINFPQIN